MLGSVLQAYARVTNSKFSESWYQHLMMQNEWAPETLVCVSPKTVTVIPSGDY
jgi:hypothetical protein